MSAFEIARTTSSVCWLVFIVYWLVTGLSNKKTVERPKLSDLLANRIPTVLGVWILFGDAWLASRRFRLFGHIPMLAHIPGVIWAGAALCLLGVAGAIWARRTIGRNWSGEVVFKEKHELVESGPYRFVRHPIYTSMLTMALGTALTTGYPSAFMGVLLMGVGFWIKLRQEERLMLRHFPAEYPEYMSRVKTLVPFVW